MVRISNEVGTVAAMFLFIAAYLTFSNNFHFVDPQPTLVDKMFRSATHDGLRNSVHVARGAASAASAGAAAGSGGGGGRQARASAGAAAGGAVVKRSAADLEVQVAAAAEVWPPKLSVYLGDADAPPAPLAGQPEGGCLYQNLQGHAWRFCLPSLLTISCINCGTTSLGAYLDGHAHLSVGTKKEHKYFVVKCSDDRNGAAHECDWEDYAKEFPSLPRGCEWNAISGQASGMKRDFSKAFANMDCGDLTQADLAATVSNGDWEDVWGLDISPKYFFVSGAARRIHSMMPHARLIALLRNPVDRHLSHIETKFRMQVLGGDGKQVSGESFQSCVDAVAQRWGKATSGEGAGPGGCPAAWVDKAEAFLAEEKSYSHYIHHFNTWFELYGKDRFLFIADTTLHDQGVRQQLMDEISAFAGVPQYQYPAGVPPLYDEGDPSLAHASTKKWVVSDRTREVLWDLFELDEHNAELYSALGRDFGWTARKQ